MIGYTRPAMKPQENTPSTLEQDRSRTRNGYDVVP